MRQSELIQVLSEAVNQFSWFLGAGTSQSAGLPTAWDVMWDLKRRHYCKEENQEIAANDVENAAVREKITAYMDAHNFPPPGDPGEYSACFKLIFRDDYERQRAYLSASLDEKRISLTQGHRILAALMSLDAARTVFTTNFDSVIEKAYAAVAGKDIAAFHLEGSYAALTALNREAFPIYTKLHGDFRYRSIKNLEDDLKSQNEELGRAAVTAWNRFGLVVAGYSGRDDSVMALMRSALEGTNPFPHGLYWTTLKGRPPMQAVTDLIAAAKSKGVKAEIVEIETFDSFMSRLWRQLPNRPGELVKAVGRAADRTVNIDLPGAGTRAPIIRMNALPIAQLPSQCFKLTFKDAPDWEALRKAERAAEGAILLTKEVDVYAWGLESEVRKAFGANAPEIAALDIGDRVAELDKNLYLKGFVEGGLALALKRGKPLVHRASRYGSTLIVERQSARSPLLKGLSEAVESGGHVYGQVSGLMTKPTEEHPESISVWWAEAVEIDLQQIGGRTWVLLKPDVYIWPRWARREASTFLDRRMRGRYNGPANALMSAWIELLLPGTPRHTDRTLTSFDHVAGPGNPTFVVNDRTGFSKGGAR